MCSTNKQLTTWYIWTLICIFCIIGQKWVIISFKHRAMHSAHKYQSGMSIVKQNRTGMAKEARGDDLRGMSWRGWFLCSICSTCQDVNVRPRSKCQACQYVSEDYKGFMPAFTENEWTVGKGRHLVDIKWTGMSVSMRKNYYDRNRTCETLTIRFIWSNAFVTLDL